MIFRGGNGSASDREHHNSNEYGENKAGAGLLGKKNEENKKKKKKLKKKQNRKNAC